MSHVENHSASEIVALQGLSLLLTQGFISTIAFPRVEFLDIEVLPGPAEQGLSGRAACFSGKKKELSVRMDLVKHPDGEWEPSTALLFWTPQNYWSLIYFSSPIPHWADADSAILYVGRLQAHAHPKDRRYK